MPTITIEPATSDRFDDVEHTFDNGGDGRIVPMPVVDAHERASSKRPRREQRKDLLRTEMAARPPPGLIAYVDGEAAGWVRVGPRTRQVRLGERAFTGATEEPLDDDTVWAVSCFVIRREHRGAGPERSTPRRGDRLRPRTRRPGHRGATPSTRTWASKSPRTSSSTG